MKPWERQESRLAKAFGGARQPGSGNGWARKGDVRTALYLISAKCTQVRSFVLRLDDLHEIATHADRESRIPVLALEIGGMDGKKTSEHYVVLREHDFHLLTHADEG